MSTIVITGSSRGIGLALTKQIIAVEGYEVIGTSTSGKPFLEANNFQCYPLNLNDKNSITNFTNLIKDRSIDYLINNAGILLDDYNNPEINITTLEETFKVNLFGTISLTESVLRQIKSGGHIINVTSEWGAFSERNFDEYQPCYKMSKTALNMYTKLLAERLKPKQIKVSSFDPGWAKTDMGGAGAARNPEDVASELLELATGNVKTGKFWHQGNIREW